MRQMGKKYLVFLLCISLVISLAGCKSEDNDGTGQGEKGQSGAKGRYVEQFLAPPEGYQGEGSVCIGEKGALTIVDGENGTVSTSSDYGKTWSTKKNKILLELLSKESVGITSAVMAPNGDFFISYIIWNESSDEKPYPERYIYVDSNGNKEEFQLGLADYHACVEKAVFTKDSKLFVALNDNVMYEIDGKKKKAKKRLEMENGNGFGMYYYGSSIAIHNGKKVFIYQPETGSADCSDTVLNEYVEKESKASGSRGAVILGGNDGEKIFIASGNGICSHVVNGSVIEQLAEGNLTSLGDPSKIPSELFVLEDGSILIAFEGGELDIYRYDAEASVVPEKQLKIYSLYENSTAKRAISCFRENNPDVYVRLETGVTGEDGVTESDAVKNLNTEILAGTGPDIILLDGMPVDSYVQKGVLMDLSTIINELEVECGYYKNILEAYSQGENLYTVPTRFKIPLISGDKNEISSITDLKTMADAIERLANSSDIEETVFGTYQAEELLKRLYPLCESAWCKEDGSVDQNALLDFLTQAKRIYKAEQKNLDSSKIKRHDELLAQIHKYGNYYANEFDASMQMNSLFLGRQTIVGAVFGSMSDLKMLVSVNHQRKQNVMQSFNGQVQNVFIPSGIVGILADVEEPGLASEFVKEMLGEKVQKNDLDDGFPVNKDAFKTYSRNPSPDSSMVISAEGSDEILEVVWPNGKELAEIEALFEGLLMPADLNYNMRDEVIDIATATLTGEKGIEDGAKEISQKIMLLKEE